MTFYIDEDAMANALKVALSNAGFEVLTAQDAGHRGWGDEAHLEFAARNGFTLYSFNRHDFSRIHKDWMAAGKSHSGIVLLTNRRAGIGYQLRELVAFATMGADSKDVLHYI